MNNSDLEIETLLDLDGEMFPMDSGYWVKFEIRKVEPNIHIPHGIKYVLTLHDSSNQRVLGYDNAHGIKPRKRKYGAKKVTWDHKHKREKTEPYEYENAGVLLHDFWVDAYSIIPSIDSNKM